MASKRSTTPDHSGSQDAEGAGDGVAAVQPSEKKLKTDANDIKSEADFLAKMQALKEAKQASEARIQALKEAKQAAEARIQALKEAKQAAEARIQAAEQKSIKRWIELSKMGNEEAKAELDMELKPGPGATKSSHVRPRHEIVTEIDEADFKLGEIPLFPLEKRQLTSHVLVSFVQTEANYYWTESDINGLIGMAIKDALTYMNILLEKYIPKEDHSSIELKYRTEYSMFSNKPDHNVISVDYQKFKIVLPVEVKKDHKDVFTSKKVGGQVFDYIMLHKMLTGQSSLAILTTFNQSKIVWDSGCNDVAKIEGRFAEEKVQAIVDSIINTKKRSNPPPPSPANDDSGDYKTPPVRQHRKTITESPPELVEDETENQRRSLVYSKETYSPFKLLPVLCNAVMASLKKGSSKITIPTGNLQAGQTILVLRGEEYEWRTQPGIVEVTGSWNDFKDTQNEYLVRSLVGVGSTSRCWGAVVAPKNHTPGEGFSCVIKYWIKIWETNENKRIPEERIKEESKNKTSIEVENYKKIYSELFFQEGKGGCVGQKILNDTYCVILPFFDPIGNDERKDKKVLEEVRHLLSNNFYNKGEGISYQFKETDQQWRHIGRWTDSKNQKHLVLFDLADLEIKEVDKDVHKKYVDRHIQTLQDSLPPLE